MNKTLLIVICDFLLISILAIVDFKPEEETPEVQPAQVRSNASEDMVELLQLSLEHESDKREALEENLNETSEQLKSREEALSKTRESLQVTQAEREALAAKSRELEENLSRTEESLNRTNESLQMSVQEKEILAANLEEKDRRTAQLQNELQQKLAALEAKESALNKAETNLRNLEEEQNQLSTQLKIRDTEAKMLEQNLIAARAEVERAQIEAQSARKQTEKLTVGVNELAASSSALKEEFSKTQPISLNAVYRLFEDNRVLLKFNFSEKHLFGSSNRSQSIQSALLRTNEGVYAIFSTANTPFSVPGGDRNSDISAIIQIGDKAYSVPQIAFMEDDNRIAAIRIPASILDTAGLKPFALTDDPLRFPNAVLVSDSESVYGEIPVRVPANLPDFIDVEAKLFNRLFGEFSPSAGDYVFSKTGDLMAIMVSDDRARLIKKPNFTRTERLAD